MRTNVTMLYGHIETVDERVDHMLRARALQDETGGFRAFIPLAFHLRQQPDAEASGAKRRGYASGARGGAIDARQHRARESILDCDGRGRRPDGGALVRRGRSRRHGAGREDLSHGRIEDARRHDRSPASSGSSLRPAGSRWNAIRFTTWWDMLIPLLTGDARNRTFSERQPLPDRYIRLSDEETEHAHPRRPGNPRFPRRDPRPSLPARRSDRLCRLHRGFLQARAAGEPSSGSGIHRVLRRAFHGGKRGRPERPRPAGDSARPGRRMLDVRHGRSRSARHVLERSHADGRCRRVIARDPHVT